MTLAMLAFLCACEAVPTLTFEEADAAADAPDAPSADALAGSDGGDAGCSLSAFANAQGCCNTVVCGGLYCQTSCTTCERQCSPGQLCCTKLTGAVECHNPGAPVTCP
jgi:hypothetical protein